LVEGDGAAAAGLPAGLGWERLENGRRILGALGARARGWHGGEFEALAPVRQWIGELSGEDQRCLLFAAAEGLGTGVRWGSTEQRCFWLIWEMGVELGAADVRLLGAVAGPQWPAAFELALSHAAKLLEEGAPGAPAVADGLADRALGWNPMYRISARARHAEDLRRFGDFAPNRWPFGPFG
jgi:hypothetical protein